MPELSKSDREGLQELIRMTLDSPIKPHSTTAKVDGVRDIASYKGVNTDVKTRMVLKIAMDAMNGDRGAAEWLMKYGALEPVKETRLTVQTPTFIDDMGGEDEAQPAKKKKLDVYIDPLEAGLITDGHREVKPEQTSRQGI